MQRPSARHLTYLLASALATSGCHAGNHEQPNEPTPSASVAPPERPKLHARAKLLGLELPASFRITHSFNATTHLSTSLSLSEATHYFKEQLLAEHVELESRRSVFPGAYLKADPERHLLRVELKRERGGTAVRVRDITPAAMTQGLTQAERWEQAGRNADGSLKDPSRVF